MSRSAFIVNLPLDKILNIHRLCPILKIAIYSFLLFITSMINFWFVSHFNEMFYNKVFRFSFIWKSFIYRKIWHHFICCWWWWRISQWSVYPSFYLPFTTWIVFNWEIRRIRNRINQENKFRLQDESKILLGHL